MTESLRAIVSASSVCELFWADQTGGPSATVAILLWCDDVPAIAFTFASVDRAEALAQSTAMCVTLTEPRSTGAVFSPVAIHGNARLVEDLSGNVFTEQLLTQELRRYPPSRAYADSLLLQRENWWYLPRLIVRIEDAVVRPIAERSEADHHVVAVSTSGYDLQPLVATLETSSDASATIKPLGDRHVPNGSTVAIGQDASFPDLEQWSAWTFRGHTTDGRFAITEQPTRTGLDRVPSLWQRLARHRRFERACRSGIKSAERLR